VTITALLGLLHVPGLVLGVGVVAVCLAWLVGLALALHGTLPRERARILEAYGRAIPGLRERGPRLDRRRRGPNGPGG
jgi:preprotein translocase subunit SecY